MPKLRFLLLILVCLLCFVPVFAQDDQPAGDKTLPGEGDATTESADAENTDDDNETVNTEVEVDFAEMLEQGDIDITIESILLEVDFEDDDDWENYSEDERFVEVDDGVYVAEVEGNNVIWGQNEDEEVYDDVVIQVTAAQAGGEDNNGYGVMCRTDENSNNLDGYHFWIASLGFGSIWMYETGEGYTELASWESDRAINEDDGEENIIHVVCVDEYLALYVNGELIVEAEDDTFDEGVTGLVVRNFEDDGFARATFDDLTVYAADD